MIGGYYREGVNSKFTFLTVPKAGHYVPTSNLDASIAFLADYINNGRLTCKRTKGTCNLANCQTMKCNGHGTCSEKLNKCQC